MEKKKGATKNRKGMVIVLLLLVALFVSGANTAMAQYVQLTPDSIVASFRLVSTGDGFLVKNDTTGAIELHTGTTGYTMLVRNCTAVDDGSWWNMTFSDVMLSTTYADRLFLFRAYNIFRGVAIYSDGQVYFANETGWYPFASIEFGKTYNLSVYFNATTDMIGCTVNGSTVWLHAVDGGAITATFEDGTDMGQILIGSGAATTGKNHILSIYSITYEGKNKGMEFSISAPDFVDSYKTKEWRNIDNETWMKNVNPHSDGEGEYYANNTYVFHLYNFHTRSGGNLIRIPETDQMSDERIAKQYINFTPLEAKGWLENSSNKEKIYIYIKFVFDRQVHCSLVVRWISQEPSTVIWTDYLLLNQEINSTSVEVNVTINRSIVNDAYYNYNATNYNFIWVALMNNYTFPGDYTGWGNRTNFDTFTTVYEPPSVGVAGGLEFWWDACFYTLWEYIESEPAYVPSNTIYLKQGWNLIGMPYTPTEKPEDIMKLLGEGTKIYYRTETGEYNMMSCTDNTVHGTPFTFEGGKGYWIYAPSPVSVTFHEYMSAPTTIALNHGWNLIAVPQGMLISIDAFLSEHDYITKIYYKQGDEWQLYTPEHTSSSYLPSWVGIYVYCTEEVVLTW